MFKKPYLERGLKGEREIYVLPSGYRILNTAIRSVSVKDSKFARVVPSIRLYVPEVGSEFFEDVREGPPLRPRFRTGAITILIAFVRKTGRSRGVQARVEQ